MKRNYINPKKRSYLSPWQAIDQKLAERKASGKISRYQLRKLSIKYGFPMPDES